MTDTIIHLSIEQLEEDLFLATSKDVPGLVAEGRSIRETVEIAQDAARKIAASNMVILFHRLFVPSQ